jgi:hypothetical protein
MVLSGDAIFGKSASWFCDGIAVERYIHASSLQPGPRAWRQKRPEGLEMYCRDRFRPEGCPAPRRRRMSEFHVRAPRQADEAKPGSFRYLCIRYFESGTYRALDGSTRNWQRRALDEIAGEHGAKPVAMMQPRHVRGLRDAKAATPAAANQLLKALRRLFSWANEAEETTVNPTIGVQKISYRSDGHHTWTDEEIRQYYERHPLGTKARLALDLLRYTTGRREDAPRLGRQNMRDGRVRFRQAKNEHRNPIDIDIPLHPALDERASRRRDYSSALISSMRTVILSVGC